MIIPHRFYGAALSVGVFEQDVLADSRVSVPVGRSLHRAGV